MDLLDNIRLSDLRLYLTAPYTCTYLPDQQARSQVASPSFLISSEVYSKLVQQGFRRSGTFTYRPHCGACQACVPVRVAVADFAPSRTQRRTWQRHKSLHATLQGLEDQEEYYKLYQRYQDVRHPGGSMNNDNRAQYQNFLLQSQVNTMQVVFRANDALRMVSIIDLLEDGLSAVYTYYDPDVPQASFGVYNVLWQIELCRKLGLEYLYLGYWIKNSEKMAYKKNFQPQQGFKQGKWQMLATDTE